jgi:hypothetical protein
VEPSTAEIRSMIPRNSAGGMVTPPNISGVAER